MGTKIIEGVLEVTQQGTTDNSVVTKATLDASLANVGSGGSDIIDIPDEYVRITDLDSGIYRLTYEGAKQLFYNGSTGSQTRSIYGINPAHLFVNKKQESADSEAYWSWYVMGSNGVGEYAFTIYYGVTSITKGSNIQKSFDSFLTSITRYVKNELTYSTSNTSYVLSAYQGYLLDQNKQNKTDETLETTNKTIVGAINELNGKVGTGSGGSQLYLHNIEISHRNGPACDRFVAFNIYSTSATAYTFEEFVTKIIEIQTTLGNVYPIYVEGGILVDGEVIQIGRIAVNSATSISAVSKPMLGTSGGLPSVEEPTIGQILTTDNFVDYVVPIFS